MFALTLVQFSKLASLKTTLFHRPCGQCKFYGNNVRGIISNIRELSQHSFVFFDVLERRYAKRFVPCKGSKVGLGFQRQTVLSAIQDHKLSLLARNITVPRLVDVYFLLSV